jgi:hypothetical protein
MVRIFTRNSVAAAAFCAMVAANNPVPLIASDHADPQVLKDADANITDLFFFPDGDRYVVILDVHRALTALPPFELQKHEFKINFDWHTGLSFVNGEQDTVRYGGKIAHPESIKEDATITVRLDNNASFLGQPEYTGLLHADQIR